MNNRTILKELKTTREEGEIAKNIDTLDENNAINKRINLEVPTNNLNITQIPEKLKRTENRVIVNIPFQMLKLRIRIDIW